MAYDTLLVVSSVYDSEDDATADYHAVHDFYKAGDLGDTYDAAVISKREDGKVKIVHRHEQPTIRGTEFGLGAGLVVGALAALFPAVALAGGLIVGGVGGAGIGAITGHVTKGMSRHDLKEIGEMLDEGESGLVVVAAEDSEAHINKAISRARKTLKKELRSDTKELNKAIDEAAKEAKVG